MEQTNGIANKTNKHHTQIVDKSASIFWHRVNCIIYLKHVVCRQLSFVIIQSVYNGMCILFGYFNNSAKY